MTRQLQRYLSLLLVVLTIFSGCHATQPFYFHEDGDLSHYLDRATQLETPDLNPPHLAEVDGVSEPFTLSNPQPASVWDLQLEEVISITLQNSMVIRNLGGVTPFGFADALVGRTGNNSTVYDPAVVETDPQSGVEAALSAFDAQINILGSSGNGNLFNKTDRPSLFGAGAIVNQVNGGLRSELSKRTASGTQLFARNITEYTRGNTILGVDQPINSIWQTTLEVEARQPILQGRGTLINRLPIILARINTDASLVSFESSVRNLLLDVENTYWDLHLAYRNLETARIGRDSAQVTWRQIHTKQAEGVTGIQEELQAREQFHSFEAQLLTAQRDLFNSESRLRFLMGLTATDGRLIRPIDEPTIAGVEFDWAAIHEEALVRSPELRQQKWLIQRRELELVAAKNQLLPQFDLGATYRWYGIGDHLINADRNGLNFPAPGSTSWDVLTEGQFQEAAFFLQFQMPVGFRRALSGVRNAQLAIARDMSRLQEMELNTSHLLTSTVRNLDANRSLAHRHFLRWSAAVQEVQTTQLLYENGRITLDLVLDAQRRRAVAQFDYYRSIIDYNKSIAEVHFRKGSLFEYNNVRLAEGAWPEKAYWDSLGRARQRDASYYLDYGWTRPRVISQGPIPKQWDRPDLLDSDTNDGAELIPPGEPTPADMPTQPPAAPKELPEEIKPQPKPKVPGPITSRPDGPDFNAPVRRADVRGSGRQETVQVSKNSFDWGLPPSKSPTATDRNPLRQVSFEE